MGEGFQSDKITLSTNIWLYMYSHPLGYNWGFRVGTGVGEGFQSEKITLSTNIWLYMYTHPLGYNWGGLGFYENIAPATQKRNFSEASKILHLPHKKEVGSPLSLNICTCHTKRS